MLRQTMGSSQAMPTPKLTVLVLAFTLWETYATCAAAACATVKGDASIAFCAIKLTGTRV